MAVPNPNIPYDGYVLPRDAGKNDKNVQPPTTINYGGGTLPQDAKKIQVFTDFLNKPGKIILLSETQQIELPPDTIILPEAEKILVKTKIIDGVPWFEKVARESTFMEMRGTLRMQQINGTKYNNFSIPQGLQGYPDNIFPQDYINDVWQYTFLPDTVLVVKNSLLNGIGIQQVIVEKLHLVPVPGSTDVGFRLAVFENVNGPNLIITG